MAEGSADGETAQVVYRGAEVRPTNEIYHHTDLDGKPVAELLNRPFRGFDRDILGTP